MAKKFKTEKDIVYTDDQLVDEIGKEYTQKQQKTKLVERDKDNAQQKTKSDSIENYYSLKTDAVERLVNADKAERTPIDMQGHNPYKIDKLSKIPVWVKACFLKWWFAAAMCFFFYWGLGTAIPNFENLLLVLAIAIGLSTDLILNNIFRFVQTSEMEYNKWMLAPQKKLWTLFVNLFYGVVLTFLVAWIYQGINMFAISVGWAKEGFVWLGVEPILFGLFFLGADCFFLLQKNLIAKAVKKSNNKTLEENEKND